MPWSFKSDSCGYMLYKDGVPQGGARTLGTSTHTSDGRLRSPKAISADRKMYAERAKQICDERNQHGKS